MERVQHGSDSGVIDRHGTPAEPDAADRKAAQRSLEEIREKGASALDQLKSQLGL